MRGENRGIKPPPRRAIARGRELSEAGAGVTETRPPKRQTGMGGRRYAGDAHVGPDTAPAAIQRLAMRSAAELKPAQSRIPFALASSTESRRASASPSLSSMRRAPGTVDQSRATTNAAMTVRRIRRFAENPYELIRAGRASDKRVRGPQDRSRGHAGLWRPVDREVTPMSRAL